MVFDNIFTTAQNAAGAGATTEEDLSHYIPVRTTLVPPHDPMEAREDQDAVEPQDPKIVRETAPQAQHVLNLINTLTGAVQQAAARQDTVASDPTSTVGAAAPIMANAQETTKQTVEDVPQPDERTETDSQP